MSSNGIPYADVAIALPCTHIRALEESVRALYREAYAGHEGDAHALVTGYDFHITPDGPRLIEINANAGGLFALIEHPRIAAHERTRVKHAFIQACEQSLLSGHVTAGTIAIVDEYPETQFLYPEFLAMASVLRDAGHQVLIADTRELCYDPAKGLVYKDTPIGAVYLRDTDFLLEASRTQAIRAAMHAGQVLVTPHPDEHRLLSDKQRLCTFSDSSVLRSVLVSEENKKELWEERNRYVFKPIGGYASKGVYRGDKISRVRFETLDSDVAYIAQERADASYVTVPTTLGMRDMKYDIRAYAYRDQLYLLGARVYEGQVTNLRTVGGGFAPVVAAE